MRGQIWLKRQTTQRVSRSTIRTTLERLSSFFRLIWAIPILVIIGLLNGGGTIHYVNEAGKMVERTGGGAAAGLVRSPRC